MDHHSVAAISITGSCLDVLGSLYLAYDLLGGRYGPLRLLTRAVTYFVVFGIGYALGLGLFFGLVAGLATGATLAIELNRAARGLNHYSLPWEALFSSIRSAGFAIGLTPPLGFALLSLSVCWRRSVKWLRIVATCAHPWITLPIGVRDSRNVSSEQLWCAPSGIW